MKIQELYQELLKEYGHQGWWPLTDRKGVNPTKPGSIKGYHPEDYSYPKNELQKFEIICGALLTQNTNWQNVEKALLNLKNINLLNPESIEKADIEIIKQAIKPAGYYNQKSERLKILSRFFTKLKGKDPTRENLLNIKGVGPETADSILLYAYKIPSFVVDTYTRRLLTERKIILGNENYNQIKALFEKELDKDYKVYQEFHALIVENAKRKSPTRSLKLLL